VPTVASVDLPGHQIHRVEWIDPLPIGEQARIPSDMVPTARCGDTVELLHREDREDRMGTVIALVEDGGRFVIVSFDGWDC